jgi:hypothetical protein
MKFRLKGTTHALTPYRGQHEGTVMLLSESPSGNYVEDSFAQDNIPELEISFDEGKTWLEVGLIGEYINMAEKAKHVLRNKGYGWTGLDLLGTVKLVPESNE